MHLKVKVAASAAALSIAALGALGVGAASADTAGPPLTIPQITSCPPGAARTVDALITSYPGPAADLLFYIQGRLGVNAAATAVKDLVACDPAGARALIAYIEATPKYASQFRVLASTIEGLFPDVGKFVANPDDCFFFPILC